MEKKSKLSRRDLFKSVTPFLALGIFSKLNLSSAFAAACPDVAQLKSANETEAPGKTNDYVVDAIKSKNGKYKAGQHCTTCFFYDDKCDYAGKARCKMLKNKL